MRTAGSKLFIIHRIFIINKNLLYLVFRRKYVRNREIAPTELYRSMKINLKKAEKYIFQINNYAKFRIQISCYLFNIIREPGYFRVLRTYHLDIIIEVLEQVFGKIMNLLTWNLYISWCCSASAKYALCICIESR